MIKKDVNNGHDDDSGKAQFINLKAKESQQTIINYINSHNISNICYAYKSRVKTESGLIEKTERKKTEKKEYCLEDITDVIGLRFVVLFKKDIVSVINEVISILVNSKESNNPFLGCSIAESIYYIGDVASSNITSDLENSFLSINKKIKVQGIKEGYSSFHIVCLLDTKHSSILRHGYQLPVEIQIRTVFEDAWGEIDHRHRYGITKSKDPTTHPTLSKHLSLLKKFVDACVDYADIIVEESRIEINPKNSAKILDNPKDLDNPRLLFGENIDDKILETYIKLTEEREAAILQGDSVELANCAQRFLNLRTDYLDSKSLDSFDNFAFHSCCNEALCHLSINDELNLISAKNLYLVLHKMDKNNCLVAMRLGQALGKTGEIDRGISYLKNSFELAQLNDSVFSVKDSDISYVLAKTPKVAGYYIWLKIESLQVESDSSKIIPMYLEAYQHTLKGLDYIDQNGDDFIDYTNNLLFYLTKLYEITDSVEYADLLSKELRALEVSFSDLGDADAKTLDTFLRAYIVLKDKTSFLSCAQILNKKIRSRDYDFDHETALGIMELISEYKSFFNDV
ncbi:hypothetical protein [Psychrobacter fjordensis]|uniref:hypothetical protein n=1 Tax=Psychrobacter fjordensis TaxID=664424 RepID=UPI00191B717B|nr:hypothetical protein [Psychrobacter fjordensis]